MSRAGSALWCEDLAWLLGESESALGLRGNTGSVVAMIESGGPGGYGSDHEHVSDYQLGWGHCRESAPARWRKLRAIWVRVPRVEHGPLLAYYAPPRVPTELRSELEHWAAVALVFFPEPAKLLEACVRLAGLPLARRRSAADQLSLVDAAKGQAEGLVRAAHAAWYSVEAAELGAWVG